MTDKPSLRAYLDRYAKGGIAREEMIATVAAWEFEEDAFDPDDNEPSYQDNTLHVVYGSVTLGDITYDDYEEITRRYRQRAV
ncbi:hypothetical protein [Streptomyces sp. NPDC048606]|uniref:hypothetical protein n=1 Tax=Streptomyces sp. NPDC048606 TaxID=3154726 RepID=UPI003444738F